MFSKKGFTLIELVMIIVILGILAAVALPRFFNLQTQARTAAEKGVVGGVRAGISTYYVNQCAIAACAYPATLDAVPAATACSAATPCFVNVLSQGGITSDWTKTAATTYTGPSGTIYTYTAATGVFN